MINLCCNNNRVIGSVLSMHAAQATLHAVQHAMQHMPYYQHSIVQYPVAQHHQTHSSVGHTHQSIYPTIFITILFY